MNLPFYYDTRFYIGHTPVLVVANPEMVKEITIKQSANFLDRSVSAVMHTFGTHAVTEGTALTFDSTHSVYK